MADQEDMFKVFREHAGDSFRFEVERAKVEKGRTFSEDALRELRDDIILYVGARLMASWDRTKVPPTRLAVNVSLEVQ